MSARTFSFTIYLGSRPFFGRDAFVRLSRLCQEYCGPDYAIETIDVSADRRAAARAGIDSTPTIFVALEGQPRQRLGGLAAAEAFLHDYKCESDKQFLPPHWSEDSFGTAFRLLNPEGGRECVRTYGQEKPDSY